MTSEDRRRQIFAQPGALKEVYVPEDHLIDGHAIVRGPDGWHVFYELIEKASMKRGSHGPVRTMAHATSDDLLTWTTQEPVLRNGGPGEWDEVEVGVCSVVEHDGRWYMVYNGRPAHPGSRRIGMAVSDDLWHWTKVPGDGSPVLIPSQTWSAWKEEGILGFGPKDPWIIHHEDRFIMYYSCNNKRNEPSIAVASSTDGIHWQDDGPILSGPRVARSLVSPPGFECPRVVKRDGKFYLFVMHFWGFQYAIGDDPYHFGPWRVLGPFNGAVIFNDEERWYITHAYYPFGKRAFFGAKRGPFRGLYIGGLVWDAGLPVPTDLRDVMEDWPQERDESG